MESYKIDVTEMSEQDKVRVQEAAFKLGYYWGTSKDSVTNLQAGYYYLGRNGILCWDWASSGDYFDKEYIRQITLQQLLKLAGMEGNMTTKQFSKKDLVAGKHVVKFRGGSELSDGESGLHLVIGNRLVNSSGYNDLSSYDDDLLYHNKHYDIMEVFEIVSATSSRVTSMKLKSIWKRSEKSASQIELEKLQQQIAELQDQANKLQSTL